MTVVCMNECVMDKFLLKNEENFPSPYISTAVAKSGNVGSGKERQGCRSMIAVVQTPWGKTRRSTHRARRLRAVPALRNA